MEKDKYLGVDKFIFEIAPYVRKYYYIKHHMNEEKFEIFFNSLLMYYKIKNGEYEVFYGDASFGALLYIRYFFIENFLDIEGKPIINENDNEIEMMAKCVNHLYRLGCPPTLPDYIFSSK